MDGGRWLEAFRSLRSCFLHSFFFFFLSILPVRIGPDPFFHDRPSNFHPPLPPKKRISPIPKTTLPTYPPRIDDRWEEEKEERVETSSIRWPAQDRYGRTSSPVAAVVNRYPGCLICIHPGTRASQRLERYSKGGRFLLVYLLVYLFVTPLSPFYSTTHASRFSPSSFLPLTFCAIFTTSVPPQRSVSYRGAARILSTFAGAR